ncbi:hypothetical protein RFI_02697 [Reticulomyxa filosa]|uniref:Uncharacterized protein n=1 Tax=Reticulomyxa filosa TaxID=46433 RepID=X6P9U1_RETFI|nr:hypothetical protein RFI_02697 [Reticulomyxa filosa]|eukprot:ETO34397.1 hypothetical protein RFI_02697 [Reticulomyxa filosa]
MKKKHALMMRYVSVWNNDNNDKKEDEIQINNKKQFNKWIPLVDNNDNRIFIGRDEDDHEGIRAVIGGSNNHLLFITYSPKNIDVFDLNTFQFVKHNTLPIDDNSDIKYHCFVSKRGNESNKKSHEMILFCKNIGLLIIYDEDNNIFQYHNIWVCTSIRSFISYACICIDEFILFFGGQNYDGFCISNDVYKYSIVDKKWMKFEFTLPDLRTDSIAVLNESDMFIHIIGGYTGNSGISKHIRTKLKEWMREEVTEKEKKWIIEENERRYVEEIKIELEEMKEHIGIKKLKELHHKIKKKKKRDTKKLKQ